MIRLRRNKETASAVCDDWLKWMEAGGAKPGTLASYAQTTARFLAGHPGITMRQITDDMIVEFVEEANPASRQQRRGCFANWFKWAHRTKRVRVDVMKFVPTYKQTPQPLIQVFSTAEAKRLRKLAEPDGTLMHVLLGSGLRRSEATNLTVRRVDLEHREINVVEGAKGGHSRVVPIDKRLAARLAHYIRVEGLGADDYFWYCRPGGQATRLHDRVLTSGSWHVWWRRCLDAAEVEYRKPHTTRHTYATDLRRRGLQLDDVGALLGHADIKTTNRVYVHTKSVDIKRRLDALEALAA